MSQDERFRIDFLLLFSLTVQIVQYMLVISVHAYERNIGQSTTRGETENWNASKILHESWIQCQAEPYDWNTYTRVKMAEEPVRLFWTFQARGGEIGFQNCTKAQQKPK